MDLAIEHIRSFLAVIDYGGYHRAAEALHLSQPAVSKHVRRLEDQLEAQFFDRRGRGVELSARGEEVAAELRAVLAAHDRAVAHVTRETGDGRPFLLGAIEHLVDPMLPELLAVTARIRRAARSHCAWTAAGRWWSGWRRARSTRRS